MLKKLILSSAMMLSISTSLLAGGSHLNIGTSFTKLDTYDYQIGPEIGMDLMFSLDDIPWIESGFSVNLGSVVLMNDAKTELNTNYVPYATGLYKVGIDFSQFSDEFGDGGYPVSFAIGIGYGLGEIDGTYFNGLAYAAMVEVDLFKNIGIGFSHEQSSAKINDYDFDISKEKIYITIKFND